MALKIANRRDDERQPVPKGMDLKVRFLDASGNRVDLRLDELSVTGASFTIPHRIDGVERGAMIAGATLRLDRLEIHVHLQVQHATPGFGSKYGCGVQFYPASEDDRNELIGLVSRLARIAGH